MVKDRSATRGTFLAVTIVSCCMAIALGQEEAAPRAASLPPGSPQQGWPPPQIGGNEVVDVGPTSASDQPVSPPLESGQTEIEGRLSAVEQAVKDAAGKGTAKRKADESISVNLSALIQLDTNIFSQDADSQIQFPPGVDVRNAIGFRRARLGIQGEALGVYRYRFEPEFSGFTSARNAADDGSMIIQQTTFADVWLGMTEVPRLGSLRIGHFKEPFSLERVTRDRYGTFMERSMPDASMVPGRSVGVMAFDYSEDQRMTWQWGAFVAQETATTPPLLLNNQGAAAFSARMTSLPWYDEASGGCRYWHTGIAYSYRANPTGSLLYAATPEAFFGPVVITTQGQLTGANADVDHNQLLGLETVLVNGPLTVQGEYYQSFVDRTAHPDVQFTGCYGYVTYFLTGEHKPYNRQLGSFDRLEPLNNFFPSGRGAARRGWGAWQIGYRYSLLDLDDGLVQGGVAHDHTILLNWYMNPYARLACNYVISDVARLRHGVRDGEMRILEMRAEIEF